MKRASNRNHEPEATQRKPQANTKSKPKPISIATGKPKRANLAASSQQPRPLEEKQQRFLDHIRDGSSIEMAAILVGTTRAAYDQWRRRFPGFAIAMDEARAAHRRYVACAFHEADGYARSLVDRIQRDEDVKPHLRLRAALALLRRQGPSDWLPTYPEDEPSFEPGATEPDAVQSDATEPDADEGDPAVPATVDPSDADPHPANPRGQGSDEPRSTNVATAAPAPIKQLSEARPSQPLISGPAQGQQACRTASATPSNPSSLVRKLSATEGRAHTDIPDIHATTAISANHQQSQPFIVNSTHNPKPPQFSNHTDIQTPQIEQPSEARPSQPTTSGDTPASPNRRTASDTPSNPSPLNPKPYENPNPSANLNSDAAAEPAQNDPSDHWPLSTGHSAAPSRTSIDTAFLSHYGVHQHESRHHFHRLFQQMVAGYQPTTPAEELTVFRITQKHWILRRIETWERAVADASVSQVQTRHPVATPAGALALQFLQHNDTQQSLFFHRMSRLRIEHEKTLDRLTSHLEIKQHRRKQRDLHREAIRREYLQLPKAATLFTLLNDKRSYPDE